jgi:hypothetical protein
MVMALSIPDMLTRLDSEDYVSRLEQAESILPIRFVIPSLLWNLMGE